MSSTPTGSGATAQQDSGPPTSRHEARPTVRTAAARRIHPPGRFRATAAPSCEATNLRTVALQDAGGWCGVDWPSGVALAGSPLALLGVLVAGLLASTSQRRHWRFTEQIKACANYLSEYSSVYVAYARAVNTGLAARSETTADFVEWASFNRALDVINLMADRPIVDAAHHLDRVLWDVGLRITRGRLPKEEWRDAPQATG